MSKCEDIFDLHIPYNHKAAEVIFQLLYTNGILPASITDLPNGKNVQRVLEQYFSKVGIPIQGEKPTGATDSVNLTYITDFEFIPETLEVFLSGNKLNGDQTDPNRDYTIITAGANANKSFTINTAPGNPNRLNAPPFQDEGLFTNYGKRITFNTKGGT